MIYDQRPKLRPRHAKSKRVVEMVRMPIADEDSLSTERLNESHEINPEGLEEKKV